MYDLYEVLYCVSEAASKYKYNIPSADYVFMEYIKKTPPLISGTAVGMNVKCAAFTYACQPDTG